MAGARLVFKKDSGRVFELGESPVTLGRSPDCDLVIADPYVSRHQARIVFREGRYFLENIGRNPVLLNGKPVKAEALSPGDVITLGQTQLVFEKEAPAAVAPPPEFEAQTVLLQAPAAASGPQLVVQGPGVEGLSYPLKKDEILIGRSAEAEIRLEDPAVSRRHALLRRREGSFFLYNLSQTNPVLINGKAPGEEGVRLYHGDQFEVGPFRIAFLSPREEDQRPVETKVVEKSKIPWTALAAGVLIILALGVYIFYTKIFVPHKVRKELKQVATQVAKGEYEAAQTALTGILSRDLPVSQRREAVKLLTEVTLAQAEAQAQAGDYPGAQKILTAFLRRYGSGEEALPAWEKLDYYHFLYGEKLESEGRYLEALKEYFLVSEESSYFQKAREGAGRVWLAYQQRTLKKMTVKQLLAEAERHFRAGRYLTPVNRNAFAAYQAVLAIDPNNRLARRRIEEIKRFYLSKGEAHFKAGRYEEALKYFERYRFIDPANSEVRERIRLCRQHLGQPLDTKEQKERVQRLLKEAGASSSWIMQYLFEDEQGK